MYLHRRFFRTDGLAFIAQKFDVPSGENFCRFCCHSSISGDQNSLNTAGFFENGFRI